MIDDRKVSKLKATWCVHTVLSPTKTQKSPAIIQVKTEAMKMAVLQTCNVHKLYTLPPFSAYQSVGRRSMYIRSTNDIPYLADHADHDVCGDLAKTTAFDIKKLALSRATLRDPAHQLRVVSMRVRIYIFYLINICIKNEEI